MYYIISTHRIPRFYSHNSPTPIAVDGIEYAYEKVIKDVKITASDPACANPVEAISMLMQRGIMGYRTKSQARERVKALEIKTCKYLLIE